MEKTIKFFENGEFNIRVMRNEQGDLLFCGRDVAKALGYKKPENAIAAHVDDEDKTSTLIQGSGSNYKSKTIFINESGLYSLILRAEVDTAKRFAKWVTSEVLPSIRRTGGYMLKRPDESNEQIMARALLVAQDTIRRANKQIDFLTPKAEYSEEVLLSETCLTTRQIAKELGMTAQALNRLLEAHRIQFYQSRQWMLYCEYADKGLAQNRTFHYQDSKGKAQTQTQMVWTERGRLFIHTMVRQWQQEQAADLFTLESNTETLILNTHISYEEII
jgi:prophage antirepressor-like protein